MRAAYWVVIAGCASGAQPSPSTSIEVRMATKDEFPPERGSSDPFSIEFDNWCLPRGVPAREQLEPIVAFARAHLISRLDPFERTPNSPVHTRLVLPNQPEPPREFGINVTVTPMSALGALDVSNWWSGGGGSTNRYCMHVLHEGGHTTIVLEEGYSVISSLSTGPESSSS